MNPLKGPGGYGRVVNGIMNIVMCAILSIYVLWTVQNIPGNEALPILTPLGFAVSFVTSFCVGEFIGDHIPALAWGQKLTAVLHVKNKIGAHFISVFILALVMITSISYICTWINNVQTTGWDGTFAAWIMVYPFLLGSGYVVELIMLPLAMKAAAAISGFDPAAAPAPEA
ncbi:MAG: hypothetical protein Q4C41_07465 [Eggerthellaceae bacterium]|nr:hypothetical protein [Eggerthellaceae bacterium]